MFYNQTLFLRVINQNFEAGYIDSIDPEKLRFIRQTFKELESNFFLNKTKLENELYLNFLNIFDNFEKLFMWTRLTLQMKDTK